MRRRSVTFSDPDPAVLRARQVVGLYGDPSVTWSIVLGLDLARPLAIEDLTRRLKLVTAHHHHLGREPEVTRFGSDPMRVLSDFANGPYGDHEPLVRVALDMGGDQLVLAAHHGVIDGLGLVGLAALLLDRPLGTGARGLPRTGQEASFIRGSVARLAEALVRPPERFAGGDGDPGRPGDWLVSRDLGPGPRSTAALLHAGARALARWNGPAEKGGRQPVVALGLSRRAGTVPLAPRRDTAYARVHAGGLTSSMDASALLEQARPEPDFPATRGRGLWPQVTRRLSSRLGSSLLVSNLGALMEADTDPVVRGARFWPTASGPAGVGVGLATAASRSTVTVRARKGWFSESDVERMLGLVVEGLEGQYGS